MTYQQYSIFQLVGHIVEYQQYLNVTKDFYAKHFGFVWAGVAKNGRECGCIYNLEDYEKNIETGVPASQIYLEFKDGRCVKWDYVK